MSKAWASGSTTQWRKTRRYVLSRANYKCQLQIQGTCTGTADQAHHTLPRDIAGDDPYYLLAACRACNLKAGEPGHQQPKRVSNW